MPVSPGEVKDPSEIWIAPSLTEESQWSEIRKVEKYLSRKFGSGDPLDEDDEILEEMGDWIQVGEIVAAEPHPGVWNRAEIKKVIQTMNEGTKLDLFLIDYGQPMKRIGANKCHYISNQDVLDLEPLARPLALYGSKRLDFFLDKDPQFQNRLPILFFRSCPRFPRSGPLRSQS